MGLWIECPLLMVEEFLVVEEQKEEKNYPFQMNLDTRNNF